MSNVSSINISSGIACSIVSSTIRARRPKARPLRSWQSWGVIFEVLHLIRARCLDRRAKFRTQRQPLGPTDEVGGESTIDDEIVPIHEGCAIGRQESRSICYVVRLA